MAYIVSLLIVAFCLYLVITPLLQPKKSMKPLNNVNEEFEEMTIKNVYATLNELEMDYNMKKLSDEDYHKLKREYEQLATEIISKEKKEEEKHSKNNPDLMKDIEVEIEEELAKLRKERGGK